MTKGYAHLSISNLHDAVARISTPISTAVVPESTTEKRESGYVNEAVCCYYLTDHGGERGPVILVAFKAIDPVLCGQGGGFDSHTLPPTTVYLTTYGKIGIRY